MKRTSDLSNKTKAELTAMARRKKIPVTSGMLKDELIKALKRGLRKIETQKKSKTAKKTSKKKSSKTPKAKTARKPKSASRKTASAKRKQTPVKKKAVRKKSPAKGKVRKASAKKSATRKPQTTRSPKTVQSQTRSKPVATDLPERYGDHRLVVLARDPNWAYAYWDLDAARVQDLLTRTGQSSTSARWVLRVYSATLHPVEEKGHYFDIDIDVKTGSYYLDLARPGARFTVEIGVMDASGMFRATAQSNPVILPLDHPADTIAPESTFSEDTPSPGVSSFTKPPSSGSQ